VAIVLGSIVAAAVLYNVVLYIRYAYFLSTLNTQTQSSSGIVVPGSSDILALSETPFSVGDTIITDSMEIYVRSVQFTYDFQGYEPDRGEIYLLVHTDLTNISQKFFLPSREISVSAEYDTGYTYLGHVISEQDADGWWTGHSTIDPLITREAAMYVSLPEEAEISDKPLSITFRIDGNDYICTVR
jgi:hypothetical protein